MISTVRNWSTGGTTRFVDACCVSHRSTIVADSVTFGIDRASIGTRALTWVRRMRHMARIISERNGEVSVDDLHFHVDQTGERPPRRNLWGLVFQGDEWEQLRRTHGEYGAERHPSRTVGVYRWRP